MQTKWLNTDGKVDYDYLILAGDIGGTNTNLALVGEKDGNFSIIMECAFPTQQVKIFPEKIKITIETAAQRDKRLKPQLCCISCAGPVKDNYCTPTNIPWNIDGNAIAKDLGIKTLVINDFMAISFSLPLLDVNDPEQITPLPHLDGSLGEPMGGVRAVAGAGTGLGVGYLVENQGKYIACPSEGGHIGFGAFDEQTQQLKDYVSKRFDFIPGAEMYVSGQGITNMFNFYRDVKKVPMDGILAQINQLDDPEMPPLISQHAQSNQTCRDIMQLFIKCYARLAADAAVIFLSRRGLFLAGGIASKNEKLFMQDHLFMEYFEKSYNQNVTNVLKTIPVYIIKDYSMSLYGAANAACSLML
ncbi:MAG: glucokinase [Sedimentisphaerales bacterium]|nr:glucokinase [Sedimentisphaerales bacterium]